MRKMKKILCMLLAATMILSLCSCNKEPGETDPEVQAQVAANSAEAKKYVYSAKEVDFGVDFNQLGLYGMSYSDGRVFALVEDWNNVLGGGESSVPSEGTIAPRAEVDDDMAVTPDTEVLPEDGVMEEYVYTGPSFYLISVNMDGSDKQIKKLDIPQTGSYSYISSNHMLKDGSLAVLMESTTEDYSDPDNPIFENSFILYKFDNQANLQWQLDLTPESENGDYVYIYVRNFLEGKEGSLSLITGDNEMIQISAQGEIADRYMMDAAGMDYVGQIITSKDGSVYATSYNEDWTKMFLAAFNVETGELGEKKELPSGMMNYNFYGGTTTDIVLSNNMGIYTYNIGDAEPTKIMDFINSDLSTYGMNNITFIDDKSFVANYHDSVDYVSRVAVFTYVDPATIADRAVITLGCQYIAGDVRKRVIEFNKTNTKYRVTVKSYGEDADWEQAITNMNNDIISGKMPDIVIVDNNQDLSSWANKGLLADINALIAADSELSGKEFLKNIWDAYAIDGTLYSLVPDFSVQTFAAKKSLVGNRTGWTMSEFQQFMKSMDSEMQPFGNDMLRESFMYSVMNYCGSDFVDVNSGTCNFMSDEFVAMLEYAKTFPETYPDDYWDNYDWESYESMYREDKALMMNLYISRIQDLVYTLHGQMGEEVAFIGFPGINGNSSIIMPGSNTYAISAKSANIEGAWEFLRYYLTDEYQNSEEMYALPVLKSAFVEKAKKAMERPYWIDENGEKVEYDNYYYINGEEIILEQFSQAEVDAVCNFIYTLNKRSYYNQDIINIVNEEAALFFNGQKSARDVAAVIQSRVQLYVDENQ